jgi:hypothetical protein
MAHEEEAAGLLRERLIPVAVTTGQRRRGFLFGG